MNRQCTYVGHIVFGIILANQYYLNLDSGLMEWHSKKEHEKTSIYIIINTLKHKWKQNC